MYDTLQHHAIHASCTFMYTVYLQYTYNILQYHIFQYHTIAYNTSLVITGHPTTLNEWFGPSPRDPQGLPWRYPSQWCRRGCSSSGQGLRWRFLWSFRCSSCTAAASLTEIAWGTVSEFGMNVNDCECYDSYDALEWSEYPPESATGATGALSLGTVLPGECATLWDFGLARSVRPQLHR